MISGVVVASIPEFIPAVSEAVEAFPWADVFYADAAGRLVVTVEAEGVGDSIERLELLQQLPRVLSVSLVEYWLEENED